MNRLFLTILLFAGAFYSCTNHFTYFESVPPRLTLNPSQEDILFISLFDTSAFRREFNQKKKIAVYKESYSKYVTSLLEGFDNYVMTIEWLDEIIATDSGNISKDEIRGLCQKYDKDLLLVMADFSLERVQEMEVTEDDDGDKDRTARYYAVTEIPMILYDSEGERLFTDLKEDKTLISSRDVLSGLLSVGPAMGNRSKQIYPIITRLGSSYVNNFRISKNEVTAKYYAQNELEPVKAMIESGDLERAKDFMISVYEETDMPRNRRRASHNLYHLFMALGNEREAWNWEPIDPNKF